jgi:predicted small metal-binding protein
MAKSLACGAVMPGCKAVLTGRDENEVMQRAAEHAKSAHKMAAIPPEVAKKARAAIKDA